MGNTSTKEQWAGRERLALIERTAWWRGVVNRGDLRDVFGISAAQASADLQGYLALNPGALNYNLSTKRYEAAAAMKCILHEPRLEDAVRGFLGEWVPLEISGGESGKVDVVRPPERRATPDVERRVFLAMEQGLRLVIKYWSVNSARAAKREVAPHGLGHDGARWHVRAWCFENGAFRDFVLSRIETAEWPVEPFPPPHEDADWNERETLRLRPHHKLPEEARKAIERDYKMSGGVLTVRVRRAMKGYLLARLRVGEGRNFPALLEEADS
ncbi:MAG: WYL domain-containing protein [Verrucomicrobiota bacterium]